MIRPAIYDPVTAVTLATVEFEIVIDVNTTRVTPLGGGHAVTVTRTLSATVTRTFTRGAIPFVASNANWVFPAGEFACWRVWPKYIRTVDGLNPDPNGNSFRVSPAGCQPNGFTWFGNVTFFKPNNIVGNDPETTAGAAFPFTVGDHGGIFEVFASGLFIHQETIYSDPGDGTDSAIDIPIGDITVATIRNAAPDSNIYGIARFEAEGPDIDIDPVEQKQDTLRTVAGDSVNFGGTKTVARPLDGATGVDNWTLTMTAS